MLEKRFSYRADTLIVPTETLRDYQSAIAPPEELICQDPLLDFRTPGLSNCAAMAGDIANDSHGNKRYRRCNLPVGRPIVSV